MGIEELLEEIGIDNIGTYGKDDSYIVDIEDDVEFGSIYSTLEGSYLLDPIPENTLLTDHNASIQYQYEDQYLLNLIADFDGDSYKLTVKEI